MGDKLDYNEWFFYDPWVPTGLRWRRDIFGGPRSSALRKSKFSVAGSILKRRDGKPGGCIVQLQGKRIFTHRIIWEMFNGTISEGMIIDHLNRDNCDNRIENLACKTVAENNRNTTRSRRNSTGVNGVKLNSNDNPTSVVACWYEDGKQYHKYFSIRKYGYHTAMELAIKHREDKIQELNKNGANYTETHGGI